MTRISVDRVFEAARVSLAFSGRAKTSSAWREGLA
jgi:hypothetical protein